MVTRYDLDGRCDPVEGGSWVDYEDHQREVAQLQARVAELEAALREAEADAGAFRKAAQLGLTLRFHGGCAQSGAPGSPSAYEVVHSDNNVMAMREAVLRASSVIESAWGLGS